MSKLSNREVYEMLGRAKLQGDEALWRLCVTALFLWEDYGFPPCTFDEMHEARRQVNEQAVSHEQ